MGTTWEYYDCYGAQVGDLMPVTSIEVAGHRYSGFAEVSGWGLVPDTAYLNGMRRETHVGGPVLNRDRSVVIDASPSFIRVRTERTC